MTAAPDKAAVYSDAISFSYQAIGSDKWEKLSVKKQLLPYRTLVFANTTKETPQKVSLRIYIWNKKIFTCDLYNTNGVVIGAIFLSPS